MRLWLHWIFYLLASEGHPKTVGPVEGSMPQLDILTPIYSYNMRNAGCGNRQAGSLGIAMRVLLDTNVMLDALI
jgi:hypothetical protein